MSIVSTVAYKSHFLCNVNKQLLLLLLLLLLIFFGFCFVLFLFLCLCLCLFLFFFLFNNPISSSICKLPIRSEIYNCTFKNTNKVSIIIIVSSVKVFAGVLFVYQPSTMHLEHQSLESIILFIH